jgi:hypothetical protein
MRNTGDQSRTNHCTSGPPVSELSRVCLSSKAASCKEGRRATKHDNPKGKLERKERKKEDGAIPQSSPPPRVCAEKQSPPTALLATPQHYWGGKRRERARRCPRAERAGQYGHLNTYSLGTYYSFIICTFNIGTYILDS